jgi:hypothetical protein
MRRRRVPHVSLDRAWVVPINRDGVYGRSFHHGHDERLERASQSGADLRWTLWCQEQYRKRRCNTGLGELYTTSEGDLWLADIEGLNEWDSAFRKMAPGSDLPKETELFTSHQWLDEGDEDLVARCRRHGPVTVPRSVARDALRKGIRHSEIRSGKLLLS